MVSEKNHTNMYLKVIDHNVFGNTTSILQSVIYANQKHENDELGDL